MTTMNWQPPEDNDAVRLAAEVSAANAALDAMARHMAADYLALFNWTWRDERFSPKQKADALGLANFVKMYTLGQTIKALVNERIPGLIPDDVVAPCDGILMDGDGEPVPNADGGPTLLFALTVDAPVGASITVNGQTLTATDGEVTFHGLPDGTYDIAAACEGFVDNGATVDLHRNATAACGLTPLPPPDDGGER